MPTIRPITAEDAETFLALCTQLDDETTFMMLEPGERTMTVEEQRLVIMELMASPNSAIFVAEQDGQLVGYIGASGGKFNRNRHSAYIVIGVLQAYSGHGLGTTLFEALEDWARSHGLHRLELSVMTHNAPAVALYEKMGYVIEGTQRDSLRVKGRYIDQYNMAKLLD